MPNDSGTIDAKALTREVLQGGEVHMLQALAEAMSQDQTSLARACACHCMHVLKKKTKTELCMVRCLEEKSQHP